jgi:hypothetical protein
MTTRIGSQIFRGELFNLKRNSVHGWIDFGGDWGVRVELTGNLLGELAGKRFRFEASQPTSDCDCPKATLDDLADIQNGVTGEMQLRTGSDGKIKLSLEWFSQNGHILAEMSDPIISFGPFEEEPREETQSELSQTDDDLSDIFGGKDSDDDPYQLFPADLDRQLQASSQDAAESEPAVELPGEAPDVPEEFQLPPDYPHGKRSWDEVIPGLDPETKRMYDEWDEVIDGTKDVPFTSLFDPPLTLKKPEDIVSDDEAVESLRVLLARLALHCVIIHMCEHYTALDTYRWLLEDLLPEEGVHPNLGPTGFVRHYDTAEDCDACDAEFEARWGTERDEPQD